MPFQKAVRVETRKEPENTYKVQAVQRVKQEINSGDVLLCMFYARCIAAAVDGTAQILSLIHICL